MSLCMRVRLGSWDAFGGQSSFSCDRAHYLCRFSECHLFLFLIKRPNKPSVFSSTYAATVARFPQAIFLLATTLIYSSIILLAFVRISLKDIESVHSTREAGELPSSMLLSRDEEIEEAEQS